MKKRVVSTKPQSSSSKPELIIEVASKFSHTSQRLMDDTEIAETSLYKMLKMFRLQQYAKVII